MNLLSKRKVLMTALLALAMCLQAADVRTVISLNAGWKFHAGDVQLQASTDNWQTVDLPHDFQIGQPWVKPAASEQSSSRDMASNTKSRLSGRGFKEMGVGWYAKTITPDEQWRGRRILLDFEGIMLVGDVYLNGERIGGTDYGYVGFQIDITKLLRMGETNELRVRADTGKPENSRWYTGGGLFRDVRLIVTHPQLYFTRHSLHVTTPEVNDRQATIDMLTEVECLLKTDSLRFQVTIIDDNNTPVVSESPSIAFNRRMKCYEYHLPAFTLRQPHLWDTEHPRLYTVQLKLLQKDGSVADSISQTFGIRTVAFSPDGGLTLNGKKVILKGIANHHTLGALGAAAYPRAIEKRIQLLREWGFNHIRTSHNPYSTSLLDLCDRYGILVVDELYDKWLTQFAGGRRDWMTLWPHDVEEFIRRDRNHPSVILWSLGNELQTYANLPYRDWGVTPYKLMRQLVKRFDPTRLTTVAMHPRGRNLTTDSLPAPLALETDIAAYNYRYMYFPGDHRRFPNMIFYQSEASLSQMGPNYYGMDLNSVVGLAYWGMIDYLGESRGWPEKGWTDGAFDITLQPKPRAWLLRSMFKEHEPLVHIAVVDRSAGNLKWNGVQLGNEQLSDHWNRSAGDTLTLYTFTNADEVELLLNGCSLGRQKNNKQVPAERNRIRWDKVAYQKGDLEAVAYTDGRVVARHKISTTGRAVALRLVADTPQWHADGTDLLHVTVEAVDRKGRRVVDAADDIAFTVEGDARLIAVANGDMASDELHTQHHRRLYHGSCQVILRAGTTPGTVTLTALSSRYKKAALRSTLQLR